MFQTQDFIVLWLGKKMLLDNFVLLGIVANLYFSTCMRPVWTFREGTGMYRQIRYIMIITALVNLVLSIFLGRILGVGGVLLGTVIAKITTYFWYEPNILFKKFFHENPMSYYLEFIINLILLFVSTLLSYLLTCLVPQRGIIPWMVRGLIIFFITSAVYYVKYPRFTIKLATIVSTQTK